MDDFSTRRLRTAIIIAVVVAFALLFIDLVTVVKLDETGFAGLQFATPQLQHLVENILVEGHGVLFDIVVFGVLILWLDERRESERRVREWQDQLRDFESWRGDECRVRTAALVRRISGAMARVVAPGAHLPNTDLRELDLSQADFRRADMVDANLTEAILVRANLTQADLSGAYLNGADLRHATLVETNLQGAMLVGTDLTDAQLQGVTLTGAVRAVDDASISGWAVREPIEEDGRTVGRLVPTAPESDEPPRRSWRFWRRREASEEPTVTP